MAEKTARDRAPPNLSPQNIVRSVLFCQAAVRRKLFVKRAFAAAPEDLAAPPLACALSFCSYLLDRRPRHLENEAMGVCALICGREAERPDRWKKVPGLTLGIIDSAYKYYRPLIGEGHPVLEMMQERFREVTVDVDEDIMEQIKDVPLPHVALDIKKEISEKWGAPDMFPGGDPKEPLFPHVDEFVARLRAVAEGVILSQLQFAATRASLEALNDAVDRELGLGHTSSRGRVNRALQQHREFTESAAQAHYGWPPTGPIPKLCLAVRIYAVELGKDHPVVDDFVGSVRRNRTRAEAACRKDLEPFEKNAIRLRKLLAVKDQAKLLAEGFQEELEETIQKARSDLELWSLDLGDESDVYWTLLRNIVGVDEFHSYCLSKARVAEESLRAVGPAQDPKRILDEAPEKPNALEARMLHSSNLACLLPYLRDVGEGERAAGLAREFAAELDFVGALDFLLRPREVDAEDDGWHQPPGFRKVDVPYKPPTPPPPSPRKPVRPPTPPPAAGTVRLKVRLHGVTMEDVRCKSEVLLMERCADLVANECGIPREWINPPRLRGGLTTSGQYLDATEDEHAGV